MDIDLQPGKYVVAVSGGVDSMALLDMLWRKPELKIIVAHFDHGIRSDSDLDRKLVQQAAESYSLPFVYDRGNLGPGTSEDVARQARYKFLHGVRKSADAKTLVMAHHQDDLLETAFINLIRGTGRKGLISLRSREFVSRPLLGIPKSELIAYAKRHNLDWREDSTNQDQKYQRNYVRQSIMPRLSQSQREDLLNHINQLGKIDKKIEELLIGHLHLQPAMNVLDRHWFIMLPHQVAKEAMAHWLRRFGVEVDKKLLERLVSGAKTKAMGKMLDVNGAYHIEVGTDTLALVRHER